MIDPDRPTTGAAPPDPGPVSWRALLDGPRSRLAAVAALLGMLLPGLIDFWTYKVEPNAHYQFIPLIPLASLFLLRDRMAGGPPPRPGHPLLTGACLATSGLLALLSVALSASTLAVLGVIVLALGWILDRGGFALLRRVWPAWALLLLMVPLPLGMDQVLVFKLRVLASRISSHLLDRVFDIPHALAGNILHLESTSLFVADACSGINSLFSTVAVVLIYGVMMRRGFLHGLALLGCSVVLDIALNACRIVAIAVGYQTSPRLGETLESGTGHTLLGLLAFAVLLLAIRSFDALCRIIGYALFTWIPKWTLILSDPTEVRSWTPSPYANPFGGSSLVGGAFSAWLAPPVRSAAPEEDTRSTGAPRRPPVLDRPRAATSIAALALMVLASCIVLRVTRDEGTRALAFPGVEERLPEQWDGWTRVDYTESTRSTEVVYAARGHTWTYASGPRRLHVHLYYTYNHWHPFEACYAGVGWKVEDLQGDRFESTNGTLPFVWFNGDLRRQIGGQIAYTLYDPDRREAPVLMNSLAGAWSFWDQFKVRWRNLGSPMAAAGVVLILTEPGNSFDGAELTPVLEDRLARAHERLFPGNDLEEETR